MRNTDLYIYLHIPKTAGSTIRKHIEKNLPKSEALFLNFEEIRLSRYIKNKKAVYQKATENYLKKFSTKELAEVKVVYGETVPYGVHRYFNRKAKYVVFIRDPLKRTISLYNFFRTRYELEDSVGKKRDHYYLQLLVDEKVPTFDVWLKEKYGNTDLAVESMYGFFERFGYLDNGGKIKSLQLQAENIFDKFDYVGLTEKPENIYYFYSLLGINRFFSNQNISKKYLIYTKKNLSQISQENTKDLILYDEANRRNELYKKENSNFNKEANALINKSRLLTPYTQLRYDTRETVKILVNILRNTITPRE